MFYCERSVQVEKTRLKWRRGTVLMVYHKLMRF